MIDVKVADVRGHLSALHDCERRLPKHAFNPGNPDYLRSQLPFPDAYEGETSIAQLFT